MITNATKILPEPLNEIITLEKAKKQLRVDASFTDEDDLIEDYIQAAIESCDMYINGDIQAKSLVIQLSAFQSTIIFEAYPIRSITAVKYFKDNVEVTMPTTSYYLATQNLKQSILTFKEEPSVDDRPDAVTVTIAIGFESAAKVPMPIKQAILLQVSDMYERREDRKEVVTTTAQALMRPYRKYT